VAVIVTAAHFTYQSSTEIRIRKYDKALPVPGSGLLVEKQFYMVISREQVFQAYLREGFMLAMQS